MRGPIRDYDPSLGGNQSMFFLGLEFGNAPPKPQINPDGSMSCMCFEDPLEDHEDEEENQ